MSGELETEATIVEDRAPSKRRELTLQWVDPALIDLTYGKTNDSSRRDLYHGRHGDVLPGDWDLDVRTVPFTNYPLYRGLHQRFIEEKPWTETEYQAIAESYVEKRVVAGKVAEADREAAVAERLENLDRLFATIKRDGYKTQKELAEAGDSPVAASSNESKGHDEIRVAINRQGRYMSVDGRHRLTIARLAGVESVPVNVVARHAEWHAFRTDVLAWASEHKGRVYQQIDHPDLSDIPAGHHDDRVPILLKGLEGYDATGKTLIDIGAHWGHMSYQMEKVGFQATAIEHGDENIYFAQKLRDANNGHYDIFAGSVFDFPEPEKIDVVLALNVLHHLCRSWENHDRLIQFLRRIQPELILFESHRAPFVSQMKNAFRNYSPWEFADFVAHHSGLTNFELLGKADDGRLLFKFWR